MFKFKFQKALDYKIQLEDEAKARVQKKKEEERTEIEKLNIMKDERVLFIKKYEENTHGRLDIKMLTDYSNYLVIIEKKIEEQIKKIEDISLQVEKLQGEYFESVKERKIFDKLKEKEKDKYTEEEAKTEQKLIDEISNNLYNRRS